MGTDYELSTQYNWRVLRDTANWWAFIDRDYDLVNIYDIDNHRSAGNTVHILHRRN
jgi:hypothetical protein